MKMNDEERMKWAKDAIHHTYTVLLSVPSILVPLY